jgi:uncharacterized membrane protein YheB (UPF0754 family)
MTVYHSILLVAIATTGGYCITALFTRLLFRPLEPVQMPGFVLQGFVPAVIPELATYLAGAIDEKLSSGNSIGKVLDDPELLQQLKPEMEGHIDIFLRDKLPAAFPLLAGMMGEKTKATLKGAFLDEVETIFPSVMKSFSSQLFSKLQPLELIEKHLAAINISSLEKIVYRKAGRQLLHLKLAGAFAGFLLGTIQVFVIEILL